MHLLLTFSMVLFAYKKADWKNINKYGLTIFYMITCNLLYNMLCRDYLLWKYKADILPHSHVIVELLYTFIILPLVTLLYLSNFPKSGRLLHKVQYFILWVLGSLLMSVIFVKTGRLEMQHGYKVWMDGLFYPVMYGMLRLHYRRPLLAYIFSIGIIIFMLKYFNVPIK